MSAGSRAVDFDFNPLRMHKTGTHGKHGREEHELLVGNQKPNAGGKHEPDAESCFCCLDGCCRCCCKGVHARYFEMASVFFSFACLVATLSWRIHDYRRDQALRLGDLPVRVSRETLLFSRNTEVMAGMKMLHSSWNGHCSDNKLLLQKPRWEENEVGLVMHGNIDAGSFSIWWAALCVFCFSIAFQSWRVINFNGYYKPEHGPDFSRWLEYFFTSPLQILIVSTAFGFANLDSLIGQCGMQAALVLLGYDIERQVKKLYKRKDSLSNGKFYQAFGVRDVRLGVYLGFAWLLHFFIWGSPFSGVTPGIGGKYAQLREQLKSCAGNGKMPDAVEAIFWLQYILFTVFGLVCTWQVAEAVYRRHRNTTLTPKDVKDRWTDVSKCYTFLSLTAKTLLEVGLALFVATYKVWKVDNGVTVHSSLVRDEAGQNETCWVLKPVSAKEDAGSAFRGDILGITLLVLVFVVCLYRFRKFGT